MCVRHRWACCYCQVPQLVAEAGCGLLQHVHLRHLLRARAASTCGHERAHGRRCRCARGAVAVASSVACGRLSHRVLGLRHCTTAEVFGKALLRPPMSDDMDAVATAASTMTSAPSSAALRSAGTSGAVSAVLAELLMTPSQLAAVRDVMTYFLTWTPGVTAGAAGSGGASPASGAAHDPSPLTAPPARPSTPVAVASGGSDSEGVLH